MFVFLRSAMFFFYDLNNIFMFLDFPSSITEMSLDYNKITKVEVEDFIRYKNLQR